MELKKFKISEKTGFLPEKPSQKLPGDYFREWESAAQEIPQLIAVKGLRKKVNEELPEIVFDATTLTTEEQWQRAYLIVTFLAQAYLWEEGSESDSGSLQPISLPKTLAEPWCKTAEHIGVPPVATYASVVLYNYTLRNPMEYASADNLQAALSFTGKNEESWFFMVHVLEEMAAVQGLEAITRAYKAMSSKDMKTLEECFKTIAETLHEMEKTLTLMYKECTPHFFYNTLRGFLKFPDGGVIYGESPEIKHYRSGSGAQDSAIPAFSLFLGIKQKPGSEEQNTLNDFEVYMPTNHREFLKAIRMEASVRSYVLESGSAELSKSHQEAVDALASFRTEHIKLVTSYIVNVKQGQGEKVSGDDRGTGGAPFMHFLKNVRDNTK